MEEERRMERESECVVTGGARRRGKKNKRSVTVRRVSRTVINMREPFTISNVFLQKFLFSHANVFFVQFLLPK